MTHMCVAETRQPGSATVETFCIRRLIATHALRPEPSAPSRSIELMQIRAVNFGPTDTSVSLQRKHGHSVRNAAPLIGFWSQDMCESVVRPGGALSEHRVFLESTHMCVAETRQPGSATVRVLRVGRPGTSRAKQVYKNREFRLTSSCLAVPRACLSS